MIKIITDIFLNIIFPVAMGIIIYIYPPCAFIRNHIPDGLWAYAFTSALLIIWNRKLKLIWLFLALICFLLFEIFQETGLIRGTGDIIDVAFYIGFGSFALLTNISFKKWYNVN